MAIETALQPGRHGHVEQIPIVGADRRGRRMTIEAGSPNLPSALS
jgi:hypothetical protein